MPRGCVLFRGEDPSLPPTPSSLRHSRQRRAWARMRGYPQWRWHLDEVFVEVNGRVCYL